MPIYDYRCDGCGKTYDVLHKVREIAEDIVCPLCGSTKHTRLLSAPSISMKEKNSGASFSDMPPCGDGSCCGGACGLN